MCGPAEWDADKRSGLEKAAGRYTEHRGSVLPGSSQIFTTWFTSVTDALDHAVTDEEFTAHRPRPEAICGAVVVLGPLVCPPRPHCPRCTAFLRARQSLRDFNERARYRHAGYPFGELRGWLAARWGKP
jgi:hypothetical protein